MSTFLTVHSTYGNEDTIEDPTIVKHMSSLKRHLAGFDLQMDEVTRDGDCAFRNIVRQIHSLVATTQMIVFANI